MAEKSENYGTFRVYFVIVQIPPVIGLTCSAEVERSTRPRLR